MNEKILDGLEQSLNGPQPRDPVDQSIADAITDRHALLKRAEKAEERAEKAEAEVAAWSSQSNLRETVITNMEQQIKTLTADRDFYLRGVTELTTLVIAARDMLSKLVPAAQDRAKNGSRKAPEIMAHHDE